ETAPRASTCADIKGQRRPFVLPSPEKPPLHVQNFHSGVVSGKNTVVSEWAASRNNDVNGAQGEALVTAVLRRLLCILTWLRVDNLLAWPEIVFSCSAGAWRREMDGIPMEPVGKYRPDRNGSAKAAAWRNMVDQDLDDVAFLADSEKRGARLREAPVAVCSQRRALCLAALVLGAMFATALLVVYATPQPVPIRLQLQSFNLAYITDIISLCCEDCPCLEEASLVPGHPPPEEDAATSNANKCGARQTFPSLQRPTSYINSKRKCEAYWIRKGGVEGICFRIGPRDLLNEGGGEVSIDFKVDKETSFVVLNARDMNITERALFKAGGGALGPKIARTLEYPPADQTYIEFKWSRLNGNIKYSVIKRLYLRTYVRASGGARRRRCRRPPTASRLKGPRKQKSLLLKRGLVKRFAYKLLKRGLAKRFAYKLLKRGLANLMSPTSTSGVAPPLDKLRRKYNYTLSLRFMTKLDRSDKQRGFFLAGSHRHRCAVSRFWLTHARSAFPCLDEPHFRATFRLTIVRDRFHVSLTNMPIVATEEAGFYLGHRLVVCGRSLFYSDASADGVAERSLVPCSRSRARLRRNATIGHAISCVQLAFIDL
ncbi:Endoplasmic reticulum aminopeptidase 2, partial [Eumeta japonica]